MRKNNIIILLAVVFLDKTVMAQQNIGIGTSSPNASAILEIRSNNKGMLIPRVNLTADADVVTIASPQKSLLIYNTNNTLTDGEGFYFWNGAKWSKLVTRTNVANLSWGVSGNVGTSPATDFIGTTDNKALVFKTNNILSGKIDPGPNNVFFGQSAGAAITTGVNNTFLGHIAGAVNNDGSDNLFAGHFAGNANTSGSENVFLGQDAGRKNTTGYRNVYAGEDAGVENLTGHDNVFIGNGAGRNLTGSSGMLAIGSEALGSTDRGTANLAIGYYALNSVTASNNTAVGYEALKRSTSGLENDAFGYQALTNNTTGNFNAAFGNEALEHNTEGSRNIAMGTSLKGNTTGNDNVALGSTALHINLTGSHNTALGSGALFQNTSGSFNTALGSGAGPVFNATGLTNATVIGYDAEVSTSNTMVFGNASVDRWAFGLTTTNANHAITVGSNSGDGNGAYLTQGGNWVNTSDVNKKEDFTSLDGKVLLQKISLLPVTKWKYKGTNEYHIGPTSQEFYKLFGLGVDDKGISTVDPGGIALAAIQALIKENEMLRKELQKIKMEVDDLKIKN